MNSKKHSNTHLSHPHAQPNWQQKATDLPSLAQLLAALVLVVLVLVAVQLLVLVLLAVVVVAFQAAVVSMHAAVDFLPKD